MKINEKTLYSFASSKPVDREGFLNKRGEVNKAFQKRWFVLKGNLLFYYEKKGSVEPLGMIILEGCVIELADYEEEKFCFSVNFPGNRCYTLAAEDQCSMELWMKALTTSSYDYMRLMISELQRQLAEIDSTSQQSYDEEQSVSVPRPPRRQNPFDKKNGYEDNSSCKQQVATIYNDKLVELRPAPPPPIMNRDAVQNMNVRNDKELLIFDGVESSKDDFNFMVIHEYFGQSWEQLIQSKKQEKEKTEQPLIVL